MVDRVGRFWRMHRVKVSAGVAGAALLTLMVLNTEGQAVDPPRVPVVAPTPAPTFERTAIPATPGCRETDGSAPARRAERAPAHPVPFFAKRPGRLPATGRPVVGGVHLPQGSRCSAFWSTDAGVPQAFAVAAALAKRFPETGLWPVVWTFDSDVPDSYVGQGTRSSSGATPETVLRTSWRKNISGIGPFTGLADRATDGSLRPEPFGADVEASVAADTPPGGWPLLLVPAHRPADVPRTLAMFTSEYVTDGDVSVVLRSWEQRFGAVLATMGPGTMDLAVKAPPRDGRQALRLAAEHIALNPDIDIESPAALAKDLRADRRPAGSISKHVWSLGWAD